MKTKNRTARIRARVVECKVCNEQMFGGLRCFEHNPTPEQREADPKRYGQINLRSKSNGVSDQDRTDDW